MTYTFQAFSLNQVRLIPSLFQQRFELNRKYLLSLHTENLLQNHYLEAGLWSPNFNRSGMGGNFEAREDVHWGWESPTCQVRGQFLGHWLSAAARIYASTGDPELKGKADHIVAELARCQKENGGEWVFSIPEKYLYWIARGKPAWAPHYVVHKTLMGLLDMYIYAGNGLALEVLENAARWFHRWTTQFARQQMDDILDYETGGMLEAWANLYGITGKPEHLDLIYRYDRPRLFDRLLAGEDPLTNRHANTTIPEAHGAARAYEVTGDERWRKIAEAYWKCAVTERGMFATGGQTNGEIWTPPFEFAACLGEKTQEHCVVYNMVRLADYLLRWSGNPVYADYMERNLMNGTLAQQHPQTGMITYFLPLRPGGRKTWGSPTHDFWCCHGSLVQAHTTHNAYTYYQDSRGLAVCQYIPSQVGWEQDGVPVLVTQDFDPENSTSQPAQPDGPLHRPNRWVVNLSVHSQRPVEFTLKLRIPEWLSAPATIIINGESHTVEDKSCFYEIQRIWENDSVRLELPKSLWTCPLPGEPGTMAFLDGPVVLAGLCSEERTLLGDPQTILVPDNEREWTSWRPGYRARGQQGGLRFIPLYDIVDEPYTVYFPVINETS
jgi:DUF1680 family protein